jgi:hypothetical protein
MLIIRTTFIAKPGQASKLAGMFHRAFLNKDNVRVMTDEIADFNTVIMETAVKDLAEYEQIMRDYANNRANMDPAVAEEMKSYTDMWLTGKREVFRIVE